MFRKILHQAEYVQKGRIVEDRTTLYFIYAAAGGIAGLIRFLESKKKFNWRIVLVSILAGALGSVAVISYFFGDEVTKSQTKYLGLSLMIGYANPNILAAINFVLKSKGINLENDA